MISSIPNSGFGYVSVGLDKLKTYLLSQMKYSWEETQCTIAFKFWWMV
jgi:hypothetical protein